MKKKSTIGKYISSNMMLTEEGWEAYEKDRIIPIKKEFVHRKKELLEYSNESIKFLEDLLKHKGIYYIREKAFFTEIGDLFYADFFIPATKTVIEIDGGYHNMDKRKFLDKQKELLLASRGCPTIRFKNEDIFNIDDDIIKLFKKNSETFWRENKNDISEYEIAYNKWWRYNIDNNEFEISKLKKQFEQRLENICLNSHLFF